MKTDDNDTLSTQETLTRHALSIGTEGLRFWERRGLFHPTLGDEEPTIA